VPADPKLGFFPTRQAISRIAKEGRKYGVSLGVITQRPGELDPTILSQCSTVFAMRLSNDRDQDIIRSAIPDSSASTMSFLSSIGNGEAIAFGEAVAVPMRMVFERVPESILPRANSGLQPVHKGDANGVDLRKIVMRMRHIDENLASHAPAAPTERFVQAPPLAQAGDPPEGLTPQRRAEDLAPRPAYANPAGPAPAPRYPTHSAPAHAAPPASRPAAHAAPTPADAPASAEARDPAYRDAFGDPASREPAPRGELSSIRSSLLKKPLSSLIKP
jgi:hypothetical protein